MRREMTDHNPVIVALDVETAAEARDLVEHIGDQADFYKVGLELFTVAGMAFVRELIGRGKNVFLDLKLYDIGETVKRTVAQVARTDVRFLTVHSPSAVMRAAVEGRGTSPLQLLAVTVLTSFDQRDVDEMGYTRTLSTLGEWRARKAMDVGMDGLVGSALEARAIRSVAGPTAVLVTPGVRSAGAGKGDQKRVATPAEAIRDGADYLVIGRQVTRAHDPAAAVRQILDEVQTVSRVQAAWTPSFT
jgi:orotidine-5'-phosphate decarboxylase